jgi:hypothetical protein
MIAASILLGTVASASIASTQWSKHEIEKCKEALTYCWLLNRPLDLMYSADRWDAVRAKVRALIAAQGAAIIVAVLADLRDRQMHYASESTKTAAHYAAHPNVLGSSTPEMVERMRRFADEHTSAAQPYSKLIAKVQTTPLPAVIVDFDPTTQGGA